MKQRVIIDIVLLLIVLALPWWIYLPLVAVTTIVLPTYWEAIVFGGLIDTLYGRVDVVWWLGFPVTFVLLVLVIIMIPLRSRFRFHA